MEIKEVVPRGVLWYNSRGVLRRGNAAQTNVRTERTKDMLLEKTIAEIVPLDQSAMDAAWRHWDSIAKPLRSLGKLEKR